MSEKQPNPDLDLHAEQILKLEFEYARETAAQAQNDRTVVVNLYLLLVGGIGSLFLAGPALSKDGIFDLPPQLFSVLFGLLAVIGLLTLLKLIRLRQAWQGSALAMNRIKDLYVERFPALEKAFLWRAKTLPPLTQPGSITFILCTMVALIDSVALAGAVHLLRIRAGEAQWIIDILVLLFGIVAQAMLYFWMLGEKPKSAAKEK